MADRRRRRKPINNDLSDDGSDESCDEQLEKTASDIGSEVGNSEYESADEEELAEEEEEEDGVGQTIPAPGEDDENKQLDDDEDRKNPQYIPKKGTFYEHDDRTAADDVIQISKVETPEEVPTPNNKKEPKKKVWKEDDRWHHDKFNELDQSPKSRDELVEIYGYDIRNEEGPPRARRRRRYGRGPNKYTRNWEDLDAYSKPTRGRGGGVGVGRPRGKGGMQRLVNNEEEFPALSSELDRKPVSNIKQPYNENIIKSNNKEITILNVVEKSNKPVVGNIPPNTQSYKATDNVSEGLRAYEGGRGGSHSKQRGAVGVRGGRGRSYNKSYQRDQRMNEENYNRGRGNNNENYSKGRGNSGSHHVGHSSTQQYNNHHQKAVDDITMDIKSITINNSYLKEEPQFRGKNRAGNENKKNAVPQHVQDATSNRAGNVADSSNVSRPKRYSSQRQRSMPDQAISQYQHQGYFDPAIDQGYQNNIYEDDETATSTAIGGTPSQLPLAGSPSFVPPAFTSPATFPPEPFLGSPSAPRMFPPVTQTPPLIMATPAVAGTPVTVPPAIAGVPPQVGPPVTGPPPFLAPENIINYVGPPPAPTQFPGTHPPQFPPFQPFNTATQPQEIYSNGVTYYNTQSQQVVPRTNVSLQKRPKAAIPIVPPPEKDKLDSLRENIEEESQNVNEAQYYESCVSNNCNEDARTPSPLSEDQGHMPDNTSSNCLNEIIEERTDVLEVQEESINTSNNIVTSELENTATSSSLAVS